MTDKEPRHKTNFVKSPYLQILILTLLFMGLENAEQALTPTTKTGITSLKLNYTRTDQHSPPNKPFLEAPNYTCLFDWHETLSLQQVEWRSKKKPVLASIMPAMPIHYKNYDSYKRDYTHITVLFSMYKIKYDRWYDHSGWYCALKDGITLPAKMNIPDRKTRVMGVKIDGGLYMTMDCPRDTLEVHVHKYRDANDATVYDLREGKSCNLWRQPQGYLSACAIVRGEISRNQVAEWAAYHSLVGVEQFYVYLNERIPPSKQHDSIDKDQYNAKDSTNNTITLQDMENSLPPSLIQKVHFIPYGFALWQQGASQMDCTMRANHTMTWVLQIDVDEYMQVMTSKYLANRSSTRGALAEFLLDKELESKQRPGMDYQFSGLQTCNWLFQGTSEQVKTFKRSHSNYDMLAVEHFPQRDSDCNSHRSQKIIVRPVYTQLYVHHWIYAGTSQYYCKGCQQYLNWVMDPHSELRTSHFKFPLIGRAKDGGLVKDASMKAFGAGIRKLFLH